MKNFANKFQHLSLFIFSYWGVLFIPAICFVYWGILSAYNSSYLENLLSVLSYSFGISITLFVLDGFKYSNFIVIRLAQKFFIASVIIMMIVFIICVLSTSNFPNYNEITEYLSHLIELIAPTTQCITPGDFTVSSTISGSDNICSSGSQIGSVPAPTPESTSANTQLGSITKSEDGTEYKVEATISKTALDSLAKIGANIGKDIGSNAAAGGLGAAAMKIAYNASASLPGFAKVAVPVSVGIVTAGAGKAALNTADNLTKNNMIKDVLANTSSTTSSDVSDIVKYGGPGSSSNTCSSGIFFDFGFLENLTPLESLIYTIYFINILIMISFCIALYILFAQYMLKYNNNIIDKYLNKNTNNKIILYFNKIRTRGSHNYDRFLKIMLIILTLLILFLFALNYYISHELVNNLDDFLKVHNFIKGISVGIPYLCGIDTKSYYLKLNKANVNNVRRFHSSAIKYNIVESGLKDPINNPKLFNQKDTSYKGVHYWKDYVLDTPKAFLTENLIKYTSSLFLTTIVRPNLKVYKNITYCLILKIVFVDKSVRCISKLVIFTRKNSDKDLVNTLINYWLLRGENYHLQEIKKIIISYRTYDVREVSKIDLFKEKLISSSTEIISDNKEFEYTGYNLPLTTDLNKWGIIYSQNTGLSKLIIPVGRSKTNTLKYNVFTYPDRNVVQVFSRDTLMLEFEDFYLSGQNNNTHFKRVMKNTTIIYKDGVKVKEIINRKLKFIKPKSKDLFLNESFITLDIETKNIEGTLIPICISLYDGEIVQSFYISDFSSEFDMIKAAFNHLNKRKYHYQKVYIHNMSKFDGVFLLKYLSSLGDVKPLMRHQSLYEIRLRLKSDLKQKYLIILRDSYLILPSSLDKLSKTFKVTNPKTIFPIFSVDKLPLDYIGEIPDYTNFISLNHYNNYIKNYKYTNEKWDLKKELIKYCENDVISLHQVVKNFSREIFDLFRVDIHKYLTLSSIALGIYQSNYLRDKNIPKISGQLFKDIFQSYKGGLVDMYIPQGYNLYSYDVNSEYPEAMCLDMPGGYVQFIKGDLDLNDKTIFGFFKAEITAPESLDMPVLPIKHKGNTLCTLGSWTDWYFSEELREAIKYGYKVKLLQGYNFQRKNLFNEYVKNLYSIKENTDKNDPKYTIVKFILNMTYGRFGMNPTKDVSVIVPSNRSFNILMDSNKEIIDHYVFENNTEFIRYSENLPEEKTDNVLNGPNVSIAISSAVVAYGRIKINQLKHIEGIKTYYSDTDSVFTDKPLPKNLVGKKLGQLKLENTIKIGNFIAPKVYGIVNNNLDNIVKVKGLNSNLSFYELNMILYKNSTITKYQEKWYRQWSEGKIYIRNEIYSLIVTNNKRQLVYDSCSKLVATKPYVYMDGIIINKDIDYIYNIKAPKS